MANIDNLRKFIVGKTVKSAVTNMLNNLEIRFTDGSILTLWGIRPCDDYTLDLDYHLAAPNPKATEAESRINR